MENEVKYDQPELDLGLPPGCGGVRTAPLAEALEEAARPDMVRVAPGKHAWVPAEWAKDAVPRHVLCRWAKQPDGTYHPVPFPHRLVRMTPETTAMLGFVSGNRNVRSDTLLRLARAGFIECVRVSPNCWMIDLDSWFAHLSACLDDEELWEPGGEAREQYNRANGLGVEHG